MQDIKGVMKPLADSQICLDKFREAHAAGTSILVILVYVILVYVMFFVKVVLVVHFVHAVHAVHVVSHNFMFEASLCTKRLFHEI